MGREVHLQGVGKMVRTKSKADEDKPITMYLFTSSEDKVVIEIPIKASKENIIECEKHGTQPGVLVGDCDFRCLECHKDWIQEVAADLIDRELSLGGGNAINCAVKKLP